MRIAIVGAGAVGGVLAGFLGHAGGHDISVLARGHTLAAIAKRGMTLRTRGETWVTRPRVSADPADLGPQDVLLVTVKAHALPDLAPTLRPLIGPETVVVAAQNGIPWWYFHGLDDVPPEQARPLDSVDPNGAIAAALGLERAIGCVIEACPARVAEPGVVEHGDLLSLAFGAPRPGAHGHILDALCGAFAAAGAMVSHPPEIRLPLWRKLMLNMAVGPTSVLTGATIGQMETAEGMPGLMGGLMRECLAVAAAWGVTLVDDIDERMSKGSGVPLHKPSMLQDFEAGRSMEIDPIITSVMELAERRSVPVPLIQALWSLTVLKERLVRA